MRIPDNYDIYEAHEAERERRLEELPKCDICGEPIQEEYYYLIKGDKICPDCLDNYRKDVDFE